MIVIVYFFLEDSSKLFISIFIVHLFPSEPNQHFNYILIINQLDALISQIYFWNKTLRVLDSSSVHYQEFFTVHTAVVYVIQVC